MNTGNISIKASVSGNTPGLKGEKGNGIKSTVLNDDYSLTFNYTNGTSDTTPPIRGQKGEKGDNGISPSITTSKSGKVTTITIKDATGTKVATINDGVDSQGDMLKSTYDKNSNGIVDNSEKVNGHTVESNVPANAKFTDTIYTHPINSGNKHIPSGGSSGQILKWEEDGTAKWDDSIEAHREGTELKVNNYKQLIKFTKEGKTEQKTYTGKSIIAYDNSTKAMSSNPLNDISVSIDDQGIITLNGTSTDAVSFQISKLMENVLKANNNYSFYVENLGGTQSNQFSMILYGKNGTTATNLNSAVSTTTGKIVKTITPKEDYSLAYFWFYCVKGITFNNLKVRLMLVEGSYTADTIGDYEPYVGATPSPNPDYPQKIVNVRGIENLFKPTLATTVLNGITCAANRDGTYTLNGTATADTTFTIGTDKNLIIDKTYKFLGCPNGGSSTTYRMSWNFHNYEYGNGLISKKTSEARNVQITIFKGITASNLIFKPMFTEDTLSTYNDYVPYGSNYLSFKNVGKNLFNYTPVLITQVKSNLRTNNIYPNSNILLKKGTYILSFPDMVMKNNIKEFGVQLFDNNTQLATLTLSNNKKSAIFTINNDANINRLYTYLDNSDNNDATITYKNIQLEKGTVATYYESYEKKYINIDLQGNELCSNLDKTTNDELIVENSKAKINKIIKEVTFTGDEEFTKRSDGDGSTTITFNLPIHEDIVELNTVSNMFSYEQSSTSGNEGMGVSIGNNKLVYIQIKRSRLSSLDVAGFKEFLKAKYNAGTPLKIQCELIEPEVIDLGEIDFDLIENSTLTCEEESDMQIDYLTIDSNIFVQDSLDGNSSQKAPSINAVNEIISKLEARIIALENKNV